MDDCISYPVYFFQNKPDNDCKKMNVLRKGCISTVNTTYLSRKFSLSSCKFHNDVTHIPHLMEFPNLLSPKLSHTIRNKFLETTLITPYFDSDFSLSDFNTGAKARDNSNLHLEYNEACL